MQVTLEINQKEWEWIERLAILNGKSVSAFVVECVDKFQAINIEDVSKKKINEGFDVFYANYPRKKSPANAKKAWNKIKYQEGFIDIILQALNKAKKKWNNPDFMPYPASWLNAEAWKDEFIEELSWAEKRRLSQKG
jgi:hypothetical protein